MRRSSAALRWLRLIVLVVLTGAAAFVLVFLAGTRGAFRPGVEHRAVTLPALPGVDAQGIPVAAYAAVNPAMIPALEVAYSLRPPDPLTLLVESVPPIGVYLPMTGDSQFKLPPPTPTPALTPLPTQTPVLTPTPAQTMGIITPAPATFVSPDGVVGPAPLDYGGDDCAPSGWPVAGVLTQYYHRWHNGIDLGVPLYTPVVATHSGEVLFAGWRTDGYGNLVIIQNGPFITYYAHLIGYNVAQGQKVGRMTMIGWSGSTGNSTGPHVHYETRINDVTVDPLTFEQRGHPTC